MSLRFSTENVINYRQPNQKLRVDTGLSIQIYSSTEKGLTEPWASHSFIATQNRITQDIKKKRVLESFKEEMRC